MAHQESSDTSATTSTQGGRQEADIYIPVTLKASTNAGYLANPNTQINRAIMIASYYWEAVVGYRVKVLSKCLKDRQITISADRK